MCDHDKSNIKKITAGIMGIMMLFVVLFSAFYIAAEADHDCCGEDCHICICIRQCENILRGSCDGTVILSAAFLPVIIVLFSVHVFVTCIFHKTLISAKVRIND